MMAYVIRDEDAAQGPQEVIKLSIPELENAVQSSNVKERTTALNQLKQMFDELGSDAKDDSFHLKFIHEVPKGFKHANALVQTRSAEVMIGILLSYPKYVSPLDDDKLKKKAEMMLQLYMSFANTLYEKVLSLPRNFEAAYGVIAAIMQQVGNVTVSYESAERKGQEIVLSSLVEVLQAKYEAAGKKISTLKGPNLKVVAGALAAIKRIFIDFGLCDMVQKVVEIASKFAEVTDKGVKDGFYGVLIEVLNYVRMDAYRKQILEGLPTQQEKQLTRELESLPEAAPTPAKGFFYQLAASRKDVKPQFDIASLINEVDVLKDVCTKAWEREVTEGVSGDEEAAELPWKIKQLAATKLTEELKKTELVKFNPYLSTVVSLIQRLNKESAIPVVVASIRLIGTLSLKFGKKFSTAAKSFSTFVFAKMKDSNKQVQGSAKECLEALLNCITYDSLQEDIQKCLGDKSPVLKQLVLEFLAKVVLSENQSTVVKKNINFFLDSAKKFLEDSNAPVRNAAAAVVANVGILEGPNAIQAIIKSLPAAKAKVINDLTKKDEPAGQAGAGAKDAPSAAAAKDAPSASGGAPPRSKFGAPGMGLKEHTEDAKPVATGPTKNNLQDELEFTAIDAKTAEESMKDLFPGYIFSAIGSANAQKKRDGIVILRCWMDENRQMVNQNFEPILRFMKAKCSDYKERNIIVVSELCLFLRDITSFSGYNNSCATMTIPPWIDKVGEQKFYDIMLEILLLHSGIFNPAYVCKLIMKGAEDTKSPKVTLGACQLLEVFVAQINPSSVQLFRPVIAFAKAYSDNKNKGVKDAALHLLAMIRLIVGEKSTNKSFESLPVEMKKLIKATSEQIPPLKGVATRVPRFVPLVASFSAYEMSQANDICGLFEEDLFLRLNASQITKRTDGLTALQDILANQVSGVVRPSGLCELVAAIRLRLQETNNGVLMMALQVSDTFLACLDTSASYYCRAILPMLLEKVCDKDEKVRGAARNQVIQWLEVCGPAIWTLCMLPYLAEQNRPEVREFLLSVIIKDAFMPNDSPSFIYFAKVVIECFFEKNKAIKSKCDACIEKVLISMRGANFELLFQDLSAPQREAILAYTDAELLDPPEPAPLSANAKAARESKEVELPYEYTPKLLVTKVTNVSSRLSLGTIEAAYPGYSATGKNPDGAPADDPSDVRTDLDQEMENLRKMLRLQGISKQLANDMFKFGDIETTKQACLFWASFIISSNSFKFIIAEKSDGIYLSILLTWMIARLNDSIPEVAQCHEDLLHLVFDSALRNRFVLPQVVFDVVLPIFIDLLNSSDLESSGKCASLIEHVAFVCNTTAFCNFSFDLISRSPNRTIWYCLKSVYGLVEKKGVTKVMQSLDDLHMLIGLYFDGDNAPSIKAISWKLLILMRKAYTEKIFQELELPAEAKGILINETEKDESTIEVPEYVEIVPVAEKLPEEAEAKNEKQALEPPKEEDKPAEVVEPVEIDAKYREILNENVAHLGETIRRFHVEANLSSVHTLNKDIAEREKTLLSEVEELDRFINSAVEDLSKRQFLEHKVLADLNVCENRISHSSSRGTLTKVLQKLNSSKRQLSLPSANVIVRYHIARLCEELQSRDGRRIWLAADRLLNFLRSNNPNQLVSKSGESICLSLYYVLNRSFVSALDYLFGADNYSYASSVKLHLQASLTVLQCVDLFFKVRKAIALFDYPSLAEICRILLLCMSRNLNHMHKNEYVQSSKENAAMNSVIINILNTCLGKDLIYISSTFTMYLVQIIFTLSLELAEGHAGEMRHAKNEELMWKLMSKLRRKLENKFKEPNMDLSLFLQLMQILMSAWENVEYSKLNGKILKAENVEKVQRIEHHVKLFFLMFKNIKPDYFGAYLRDFGFKDARGSELFDALWKRSDYSEDSKFQPLPDDLNVKALVMLAVDLPVKTIQNLLPVMNGRQIIFPEDTETRLYQEALQMLSGVSYAIFAKYGDKTGEVEKSSDLEKDQMDSFIARFRSTNASLETVDHLIRPVVQEGIAAYHKLGIGYVTMTEELEMLTEPLPETVTIDLVDVCQRFGVSYKPPAEKSGDGQFSYDDVSQTTQGAGGGPFAKAASGVFNQPAVNTPVKSALASLGNGLERVRSLMNSSSASPSALANAAEEAEGRAGPGSLFRGVMPKVKGLDIPEGLSSQEQGVALSFPPTESPRKNILGVGEGGVVEQPGQPQLVCETPQGNGLDISQPFGVSSDERSLQVSDSSVLQLGADASLGNAVQSEVKSPSPPPHEDLTECGDKSFVVTPSYQDLEQQPSVVEDASPHINTPKKMQFSCNPSEMNGIEGGTLVGGEATPQLVGGAPVSDGDAPLVNEGTPLLSGAPSHLSGEAPHPTEVAPLNVEKLHLDTNDTLEQKHEEGQIFTPRAPKMGIYSSEGILSPRVTPSYPETNDSPSLSEGAFTIDELSLEKQASLSSADETTDTVTSQLQFPLEKTSNEVKLPEKVSPSGDTEKKSLPWSCFSANSSLCSPSTSPPLSTSTSKLKSKSSPLKSMKLSSSKSSQKEDDFLKFESKDVEAFKSASEDTTVQSHTGANLEPVKYALPSWLTNGGKGKPPHALSGSMLSPPSISVCASDRKDISFSLPSSQQLKETSSIEADPPQLADGLSLQSTLESAENESSRALVGGSPRDEDISNASFVLLASQVGAGLNLKSAVMASEGLLAESTHEDFLGLTSSSDSSGEHIANKTDEDVGTPTHTTDRSISQSSLLHSGEEDLKSEPVGKKSSESQLSMQRLASAMRTLPLSSSKFSSTASAEEPNAKSGSGSEDVVLEKSAHTPRTINGLQHTENMLQNADQDTRTPQNTRSTHLLVSSMRDSRLGARPSLIGTPTSSTSSLSMRTPGFSNSTHSGLYTSKLGSSPLNEKNTSFKSLLKPGGLLLSAPQASKLEASKAQNALGQPSSLTQSYSSLPTAVGRRESRINRDTSLSSRLPGLSTHRSHLSESGLPQFNSSSSLTHSDDNSGIASPHTRQNLATPRRPLMRRSSVTSNSSGAQNSPSNIGKGIGSFSPGSSPQSGVSASKVLGNDKNIGVSTPTLSNKRGSSTISSPLSGGYSPFSKKISSSVSSSSLAEGFRDKSASLHKQMMGEASTGTSKIPMPSRIGNKSSGNLPRQ